MTIDVVPGATVTLTPTEDNLFTLNGAQLLAAKVFDAEVASLECERNNNFKTPSSVLKRFLFFYFFTGGKNQFFSSATLQFSPNQPGKQSP